MSETGRKRMFFGTFKSLVVVVTLGVCCWGGYEVIRTWEENPTKLRAPVKSVPVRDIVFQGTDGVLDKAWIVRALALPKTASLMELDLYGLRDRLFESGQVKSAVFTRRFPDVLIVRIEERSPVARLRVDAAVGEAPKDFLVARDGVVFGGENFDPSLLAGLPYLDGLTLKRSGKNFVPIAGMETVADLLSTAHVNIPELYRNWTRVSLARLGNDGEVVVASREIPQITFGTHEDFYKQVAKLDYILDDLKTQPNRLALASVNLAVGGEQVPVAFQPPEPGAITPLPTDKTTTKPSTYRVPSGQTLHAVPSRPSSAFFNPQRLLKRDF